MPGRRFVNGRSRLDEGGSQLGLWLGGHVGVHELELVVHEHLGDLVDHCVAGDLRLR